MAEGGWRQTSPQRVPLQNPFQTRPGQFVHSQKYMFLATMADSKAAASDNCTTAPGRREGKPQKLNLNPLLSEVSKRGWREGVGDKQTPKKSPKVLQKCVPFLLRGHRKKGTEKRLNLCHIKDFLAPTPSVRQPLFGTSDFFGMSVGFTVADF